MKHLVFFSFIFSSSTLFAAAYSCSATDVSNNNCSGIIKLNSAAALGQCLPEGQPSDVAAMLSRNNIGGFMGAIPADRGQSDKSVRNPTSLTDLNNPRMSALARVVGALDKIGNGNMSALRNHNSTIQVIFAGAGTTSGNSRRHGNQIQLAPGGQNRTGMQGTSTCGGVDNIGLIAHEIGHFIGGNNNRENYNSYALAMSAGPCRLSQYSGRNQSEEFAEVVAAYITYPEAFLDKGANCRRAFEYMKRLFGEPDMTMSCDARKNSYDATSSTYAGRTQELLDAMPVPTPSRRLRFSPQYYKSSTTVDELVNSVPFSIQGEDSSID